MKPYTTLARIREHIPCEEGWKKLTKSIGGIRKYGKDTPITIRQIIDSNGFNDALWCLRTMPEHNNLWRHFAVDCAEQVKHLMKDKRSLDALEVARRHANNEATDAELDTARDAARDAAEDAAEDAEWSAAWAAAWASSLDAALSAARDAARDAAEDAERDAAEDAAREWQKNRLLYLCEK